VKLAGMNGTCAAARPARASAGNQSFLLTRVQPALSGLMDGSLSTLAPIPGYGAALSAGLGIAAAG
jgi:hypothetical protein